MTSGASGLTVAVLAHSFPRFPGDTHGPFVKRLSEELCRLGHRVHALIPFDPEIREDPDTPLSVHSFRYVRPDRWHLLGYSRTLHRDIRLKAWAPLQAPLYFWRGERALERLARREGVELLHAHWLLPNGWIAARVARKLGIPYCVTVHGSDVFMAERNPLFRRMGRRALAGAAHVTSCSGDLKERLEALAGGSDDPRIHLVPNGTDLDPEAVEGSGEAARKRWRLPPSAPLLLAVGRLVDKKGFRYLLDALPEVLRRHPDAHLVLGGGGDLEQALRARARELGVEGSVTFSGPLDHPGVLELMRAADLFVMPSIRDRRGNIDGLPVVVLEAMAAGLPVVATRVAGMPLAVADGETGLLVPERDPAALAEALLSLLGDPARRRALGSAGRRRVEEELHWGAIARVHDRLYREAVARGQAP